MGKGCIVIGAAMLDIVMEIDRIPKSGTDVYAKGQSMMVGGCAYNVADIFKTFRCKLHIVCTNRNWNVCRFHSQRTKKRPDNEKPCPLRKF